MSRLCLFCFLIGMLCFVQSADGIRLSDEQKKLLAKKPHIGEIIIKGNRSFDSDKIKSKLYTHEDGFWQKTRLKRRQRFQKINLHRDKALLDYFYRSHGFIDANATISFYGNIDAKTVTEVVEIKEGPRYFIDSVSVTGDLGQFSQQVRRIVRRLRLGEYLNAYDIEILQREIKTIYANNGYPYAEIDISLIRKTDQQEALQSKIDIRINVKRGWLVVFGDLLIDTTSVRKTSPKVFARELDFRRAQTYSRERFVNSQQRLIRTNLFNFVTLKTADSMSRIDSLMPDFTVSAIERPARYATFSTGAGQDPEKDLVWDFSGTFGNRNLKGSARKVRFAVLSSFQVITAWRATAVRFEFGYTEPYFLNLRMPLLLTFAYEPGLKSPVQNYSIETISIDATLIREFSLLTRISISGNYEQFNIFGIDKADRQQFKEEEGISVSRKLISSYIRDSRPLHNRFNPDRGSYTQLRLDYVGGILGGDNNYLKIQANWAKYNRYLREGVFASRLRLGWARPFGDSKFVPSKDRFYLGGAFTIRGFRENSIGPVGAPDQHGNTESVGGTAIGLLNLEIRQPLVWKFWWSYFYDAGINVADIESLSARDLVMSGGVGLQFLSPVGPIRLDYGRRIAINNIPAGGRFHISILYAF